jgi:hypothetical protein
MGTNAQCSAAYSTCLGAVKERAKSCRPGPDGTYTLCFAAENRGWVDCANQEIDCCERALAAQCGVR